MQRSIERLAQKLQSAAYDAENSREGYWYTLADEVMRFCEERSKATELAKAIFRRYDEIRAEKGLSWPDGPDGIYIGEVTSERLVVRDGRDTVGEYATGVTVEGALERYLNSCLASEEETEMNAEDLDDVNAAIVKFAKLMNNPARGDDKADGTSEPLAPQLLAEWEQMAEEVRECVKSGQHKAIVTLFAAALAASFPLIIAEIDRLKGEAEYWERMEKLGSQVISQLVERIGKDGDKIADLKADLKKARAAIKENDITMLRMSADLRAIFEDRKDIRARITALCEAAAPIRETLESIDNLDPSYARVVVYSNNMKESVSFVVETEAVIRLATAIKGVMDLS